MRTREVFMHCDMQSRSESLTPVLQLIHEVGINDTSIVITVAKNILIESDFNGPFKHLVIICFARRQPQVGVRLKDLSYGFLRNGGKPGKFITFHQFCNQAYLLYTCFGFQVVKPLYLAVVTYALLVALRKGFELPSKSGYQLPRSTMQSNLDS